MGRAAHQYSSTKVTFLQTALDYFLTCSAILPSPLPMLEDEADGPEDWDPPSDEESTSTFNMPENTASISSFVTVIRDIIDKNINSLADDPFISEPELDKRDSIFDTPNVNSPNQFGKTLLMPSPLKVRKSQEVLGQIDPIQIQIPGEPKQATNVMNSTKRAPRPPPLPIRVKVPGTMPTYGLRQHAPIPRDSQPAALIASITPSRRASIRRYNGSIRFLRVQITNSIGALRTLIDEVTALQESRRASNNFRRSSSFWTFSPVKSPAREAAEKRRAEGLTKTSATETKEERIARLRADGWKSVGVRASTSRWKGTEYYKRYCGSVLDELYLES